MLTDRPHPNMRSFQGGFCCGLTLLAVFSGTLSWLGSFFLFLREQPSSLFWPEGSGFSWS